MSFPPTFIICIEYSSNVLLRLSDIAAIAASSPGPSTIILHFEKKISGSKL